MHFFKEIISHFNLILKMAKTDLKNKFANTSLGAIWGFLQPIIFMLTYIFVFKYIMRATDSEGYPFIIWILPGIAFWNFVSESIFSSTQSIRTYSYLVKKIVFPVDIIPLITLVSGFIIQIVLLIVVSLICIIYGIFPNVLQLLYIIIATLLFLISFTRFTSAITTLVPDFGQLLQIIMQLLFWFTPILWNISMLGDSILVKIIKLSPFAYIITGIRSSFLGQEYILSNGWIYTVIFWIINILIFLYGNYIFNKNKKEFADVL